MALYQPKTKRVIYDTKEKLIEKILSNVYKAGKNGDGCWLWLMAGGHEGYGHTNYKGRTIGSHVASYFAFNGEVPDGMCVCHSCDVRLCCNPKHLFLGTKRDNTDDMIRKGRKLQGLPRARWKLDLAKVLETVQDENVKKNISDRYHLDNYVSCFLLSQ